MQKPIYVIADLHLSAEEPAITAGFLRFLAEEAIYAERLYILGDLFDMWIGDDDPDPFKTEIAEAIKSLTKKNIPCYFMAGNRDFLLGKRYATSAGMQLIQSSEYVLEAFNKRILLLHGDTLCTDDHRYQRYRKIVHSPITQFIFRCLTLRYRQRFAAKLRTNSQIENTQKSFVIMDVNQTAVDKITQQYQADWLVHGHTHRPAIHEYVLSAKTNPQEDHNLPTKHLRAVTGAWHQEGWFIKITETLTLHKFVL